MRYECLTLQVGAGGYRINVACTDPATLSWIAAEIERDRPSCRLAAEGQLSCSFDITGNEPLGVGWWLVKRLGEESWEPFGSVGWEESWGLEFISMRRSSAED